MGTSHQAGSDSLLTASTFFKMKQAYFRDDGADEYRGMIYGLGQSYTTLNGIASDPTRVSVMTVAEREDRTSTRELTRTQTPGPTSGGAAQQQNGSISITSMGANSLQSSLQSGGYESMQPTYMRTTMVGGGR